MSPVTEQATDRWRGLPSGERGLAELVRQSLAESSTGPSKFDIFKTGSIHGGGDSLIVSGTIHDQYVDTGSNFSMVRPDIFRGVT